MTPIGVSNGNFRSGFNDPELSASDGRPAGYWNRYGELVREVERLYGRAYLVELSEKASKMPGSPDRADATMALMLLALDDYDARDHADTQRDALGIGVQ